MPLSPPPLSLYIHLPWCVRKCPYCDFNSHRAPQQLPLTPYVHALDADLRHDLASYPELSGRRIASVFFGGGTPSLFPAPMIAEILTNAQAAIAFDDDVEVTLEANPGTIERGRFDGYRQVGVNRVSLGVQSFDDAALKRLGRIHGSDEARRAAAEVREGGIDDLNLDLMYALPEQSLAQALADVDAAIALAPTHISHYQLTLEPHTEFAARPPPLPDDDLAFDMMNACQERLAQAGYGHYETSAYAQAGRRCRHNLNYWQFGDYLGIGAGAHGKLSVDDGIRRRWKHKHPSRWLASAGSEDSIGGDDVITAGHLPFEFVLNALRLNEGFTLTRFQQRTGLPVTAIQAVLDQALDRGLIETRTEPNGDQRIQPSELGRRFLNDLLGLFLPDASDGSG